jgi:hypothetical protein
MLGYAYSLYELDSHLVVCSEPLVYTSLTA